MLSYGCPGVQALCLEDLDDVSLGEDALTALVAVLVCRWLFNIPVLAPRRHGTYGDVHTTGFLLAAAAAALVATAGVHLLLTTPGRLPFSAGSWAW